MKVTLKAITQPLERIDSDPSSRYMTPDEFTVYAARVTSPTNQHNLTTGPGLLSYCIRNGHWSVFEHVGMTVEIETSLAIAMQILRHRSFTFQMFSQRYASVEKLGDMIEPVEARMKSGGGNRQGSGESADLGSNMRLAKDVYNALISYMRLLAEGVAPESARFVLPQATKTRLYMTGNLRSWIHYLAQRTDPHAQKEHRDVANLIRVIFSEVFPQTYEACTTVEIPAHKLFTP